MNAKHNDLVDQLLAAASETADPVLRELLEDAAGELRRLALIPTCIEGNMVIMAALEAMDQPGSQTERARFTSNLTRRLREAEEEKS